MVRAGGETREWHLDRRVTVTLILALLLNAGSLAWWAATMDARLLSAENRIEMNARRIEDGRREMATVGRELAAIGANIETLVEQVKELNRRLNNTADRRSD